MCELESGSSISGTTRDLSLGGLFIEATERPAFGTKLTILWQLPGTNGEVRMPAIVRWIGEGGFGVQFGLLGARETHAITKAIKPHP